MSTETAPTTATGATDRPKRQQRFVVGRVDDFPADGRLLVEINGREIGIFKVKHEFFAMLNRCPHLGGPLAKGQIVNEITSTGPGNVSLDPSATIVTCPWHNWEFDIRSGQSYWDPHNLHARPFAIAIETGEAVAEQVDTGAVGRIKGPYKAEMIDVGVESDYIVLSLKAQPRASGAKNLGSTGSAPEAPTACAHTTTTNEK
ncbi:Rieske (2Fe-2S) protein [Subtercola boreus]|uniref:Rieske (2Fe-2S) protein n=1 Tax=Subtercola boreus TaxID=120213 RepID=UPI0011743386|nr:Rieske 2Fe-2S domain-containing protein [Subtercola boreus]TQL55947.1 3-phenylpropionate/trans-cinnamate dioxygenase ferredoxin subunit [Subtercola boreus]